MKPDAEGAGPLSVLAVFSLAFIFYPFCPSAPFPPISTLSPPMKNWETPHPLGWLLQKKSGEDVEKLELLVAKWCS